MNEIIDKALKILRDGNTLLETLKISIQYLEYPKGQKYEPSKSNPPYAQMVVRRPKSKWKPFAYEVILFTNMFEYFGDHVYKGTNASLVEFLKAIDIDFNDESLLIYNFIHEIGHILMYEEFKKDSGSYDKLLKFDDVCSNFLDIIFEDAEDNDRMNMKYHFQELYSEKFATINFPNIWNRIMKSV